MFCTDLMPCADNSAFEQRETGLNAVRVDVANRVDAVLVLNSLVLTENASLCDCARVSAEFIRHNHVNIVGNIFSDVLRQRARLHIFGMEEPQRTATLPDADNNFLLALWMPYFMLVTALLPAYERFVNFNSASQFGAIFHPARHSSADAVTKIPCSLIALLAEHPVNLTSRNALLGFGQQVSNEEPLSQWQMGVMKHGSHGHRELVVA